jgi:ankyrin repeat protein
MPIDSDPGSPAPADPEPWSELHKALRDGDPLRVRALIETGANIHYRRKCGYDALLDAVHGRDDTRLLEILGLLAAHGVDLSGISDYAESGLRVLSRVGRFDAVRLLLDAGADRRHLEWARLHEAVALGSVADVRAAVDDGEPLEARDWWSRTPWLIALLIGDLDKVRLLRERGANFDARGRCGQPPLSYAIRHPDVVRWLLNEGADVGQTDEFGSNLLVGAAANGDLEIVELFLAAGADMGSGLDSALFMARSPAVIRHLLDVGADPADLGCNGQRILIGLDSVEGDPLASVTPDDFWRARSRRFGEANPQRMREPFWEAMICAGAGAYAARRRFDAADIGQDGPVWCADRFGQSLTLLPDGRAIQIGGEHEDFYDPDFCIYNDVFVHGPADGDLAIFGYPESVFPPTDFHTATLVEGSIYVVGSLGYAGTRRYGQTPVYRLDINTLQIERVDAWGDAPGWIFKHRASALGRRAIRVWGGTVVGLRDGEELHAPNLATFLLDLERFRWHREEAVD